MEPGKTYPRATRFSFSATMTEMDPTMIETLQGVVQQSVDAMKAVLRESEVMVQNALQTALQESEANVQNTLQAAHDTIDARFRNQQRHYDEDMRALYDQIASFQRGEHNHSRWHPLPSGRGRPPKGVRRRRLGARLRLQDRQVMTIEPLGPNKHKDCEGTKRSQGETVTDDRAILQDTNNSLYIG